MESKAILDNPAQAMNVLWHITTRLASLIVWMFIAIAHLAVIAAFLLAIWATQTTPAEVAEVLRTALESKPVAVGVALGASALGVLGMYWKLVRWAHRASGAGWLFEYVMRGLR